MKKTLILAGAAALALSAAACGRMGDLEPPPGAVVRQTERAPRDRDAPSLREPATINRPSSQQPIDGGPTNPYGGAAAGREPQ